LRDLSGRIGGQVGMNVVGGHGQQFDFFNGKENKGFDRIHRAVEDRTL
jgi:hypothetical protein